MSAREHGAIDTRFAVEEEIGRGAFGSIFRGTDRSTGERVAIKRLQRETDRVSAERFRLEARLLERIEHPHVVRHIAHGADVEGRLWLVLEWLRGEDVAHRRRAGRLSMPEALDIVRQAALGLSAIHDRGITHRDIKPANLFLCGERGEPPHVKVLDLGIARAAMEPSLTGDGLRLGTPAYMSPEQVRGDRGLSPRSDLFSLGVVLYELLCGARPFAAEDAYALMMRTLVHEPPSVSQMLGRSIPALDALVARALAKSPDDRWTSAIEFVDALEALSLDGDAPPALNTADDPTAVTPAVHAPLRVVTAIFADVSSAPDREREVARLESIVTEHGGVALRTLGPRCIALFGARRSIGDEALRAARAALEAARLTQGMRLSIATSRVLESGGEFTGEAIDRGLAQLSAAGAQIVCDAVTARLVQSHYAVESTDDAWVLHGEQPDVSPTATRLVGVRTRTVGRERELSLLIGLCAESIQDGIARSALVTGPAGAGKSRVRDEFIQRARRAWPQLRVWLGRGDPMTHGTPLRMLAQLAHGALGIVGSEPLSDRRAQIVTRVEEVVAAASARRVANFLGELVSTRFGDDDVQLRAARADPMLMGDQIRRAWADWTAAVCGSQPVLIVIEDVHWCDDASVRVLGGALKQLGDRSLMLVGLARPDLAERFNDTWVTHTTHHVSLGPLTRKPSEALVSEALGPDATPEVVARIAERAGGNPFVLEELVRAFAEGRAEDVPETVLAIVQSRLDALSDGARVALRAASVLGRTFWRTGAVAIASSFRDTSPGDEAFRELIRREFVTARERSAMPDDTEYVFAHQIVRDAAYATLGDTARSVAHVRAAEWLERVAPGDPFVIAEHYERGVALDRAVPWCLRAAESAREANALDIVLAWTARGIANGATGETLAELQLLQAEAHRWRGENLEARRDADAAMASGALGPTSWFAAAGELSLVLGRLGETDALDSLAEQLSTVAIAGRPSSVATALAKAAKQLLWAGRYDRAETLLARLENLADGSDPPDPIIAARMNEALATRALASGDPETYLHRVAAAAENFELADDLRSRCGQHVNLGYAALEVGAYERAERVLREALSTAESLGLVNMASSARQNLALALARLGRLDESIALAEPTIEAFVQQQDRAMEGSSRIYHSITLLAKGRIDDAELHATRACELLLGMPPIRAYALAALAFVYLERDDATRALTAARESMQTVLSLGSIDEGESFVRWVYAEALARAGRIDEARSAICEAHDRLTQRAERFRDSALRRSFVERIPENAATLRRWVDWRRP